MYVIRLGSVGEAAFGGIPRKNWPKLREVIFDAIAAEAPGLLIGEIEVDESSFGGHRKGKRGRGAAGKVPVFGLLKRQAKVYVAIIANAHLDTFISIIRAKIRPCSVFFTDALGSFDVLDVSEFQRMRSNTPYFSQTNAMTSTALRTSGTRTSVSCAHIMGIPRLHFHQFVEECEWRSNCRPIGRMQQTLTGWWFK